MSNEYPNLANAPIKEAIVDIRLKLPKEFNVHHFKSIGEKLKNDYPTEKTIHFHETKIGLKGSDKIISTHEKINGYRYESLDGIKIVQLKDDGFTYNRLKPYESWDEVRDEAMRIWNLYTDLIKPEFINRIALRYINNLNAPLPMKDFKDYLTCPPEVPEGLPQGISSFLYRVVVPHSDSRITAIITQAMEATLDIKNKIPIILDIDVFKITEDGFLKEDILVIFEKLRIFKNQVFFKSITPKLLETYQ